MLRARSLLLKATVAVGVLAALAACDAPSALAPSEHRPSPSPVMASSDTLSARKLNAASATADEETCRSGYQVAYREDGTPYCSPIE